MLNKQSNLNTTCLYIPLEQGWANFSEQGLHSEIHNFEGPHYISKII